MLPWREHDDPQKEHVTVWTVFPASSNYFDPSPAPFMFNYIVDDLDALLGRLEQEGVKIDPQRMNESYGSFAWIYDLDGNKSSFGSRPQSPKKPSHCTYFRTPISSAEVKIEKGAWPMVFGEAPFCWLPRPPDWRCHKVAANSLRFQSRPSSCPFRARAGN